MKTGLLATVAALGLGVAAGAASAATLDGDSVGCDIVATVPWTCSSPTAVVGAGAEFTLDLFGNPRFDVDIGSSSIRLDKTVVGLFTGAGEVVTFSDLDFSPSSVIVGIANFVTTASGGIAESDVTFGDDWVRFDFNNSSWQVGQYVSFDLITREVAPVPLPAGLPLLLAGVGALGIVRRRARRG